MKTSRTAASSTEPLTEGARIPRGVRGSFGLRFNFGPKEQRTQTMNERLVPAEVAAAISAARPELLKLGSPRAMNAEEVQGLYVVIGDLISAAFEHQAQARLLRRKLQQTRGLVAETVEHMNTASNAVRIVQISLNDGEIDE